MIALKPFTDNITILSYRHNIKIVNYKNGSEYWLGRCLVMERKRSSERRVTSKLPAFQQLTSHTHTFCLFSTGKSAVRIKAQISIRLPSRTMFWLSSHNALCQGRGAVDWLTSWFGYLFLFFPSDLNSAQANLDSSGAKVVLNNVLISLLILRSLKVQLCMHESYACSIVYDTRLKKGKRDAETRFSVSDIRLLS